MRCSALNELKFANLPVRIVLFNYVTKIGEWNSFPRQSLVGRCSCDVSNEMFDKPTNFTKNRPKTQLTNKRRIKSANIKIHTTKSVKKRNCNKNNKNTLVGIKC